MRASLAATIVVVLLALARPAAASDDVLFAAEVKDAEAEVRCGPGTSDQLYPTNRLKKGDIVQVVEELSDGWYKIRPPHGSFSFINSRFVDRLMKSNYAVVPAADMRAPVFVGSDLRPNERGVKEGTSLPRGSQVIATGESLKVEDESWLRIEPPPGEFRYIREASVRKVAGLVARGQAPGVDRPPAEQPGAINSPAPGQDSASATALIVAGIKADNENRYPDAINYYHGYLNAAQRIVPLDQQRIMEVQKRVAYLEQQVAAPPPASRPAEVGAYPSSGPGVLYRSGRKVDDVAAYRLESDVGNMILYVTPRPGVNLEPYVGRRVELLGPAEYRPNMRANYMVVEKVREVP